MNYKLLFIISLLLIVGCSKEPVNMDEVLIVRDKIVISKFDNKIYSGPVFSLHPNAKTKIQGYFKNGKMSNKWKFYDEKGNEPKLKNLNYWKDLKYPGYVDNSFINLNILDYNEYFTDSTGRKIKIFNEEYETLYAEYSSDYGKSEEIYLSNGELSFPLNGQINYFKKEKYSPIEIFVQSNFVNGLRSGKYSEYYLGHDSLRLITDGFYVDGTRKGKWTWWYGNGHKKVEVEFTIGNFDNDINGSRYHDHYETGRFIEYYKNGQIKEEGYYCDPGFSYVKESWGGKKYRRGIKKGKWTYYNEDGSIRKLYTIDHGEGDCG